jgi:undecaprenyl-diphosphatase
MIHRFFILGAIQGLTEFLPISSSGHLVIFQKILHIAEGDVGFDIIVHLASLAAVIFFFKKELASLLRSALSYAVNVLANKTFKPDSQNKNNLKVILFIFYATLVTGIIGFVFKDLFEKLFSSIKAVSLSLAITGAVLFMTRFKLTSKNRHEDKLGVWDGLVVGFAQGLAIVPGLSRSGLTICAGIFSGIERALAVRLSFLLSIPAIIAAAVFKIKDLNSSNIPLGYLFIAFISAFIFAFASLKILLVVVQKCKLHYFAYYCWLLSIIVFLFVK